MFIPSRVWPVVYYPWSGLLFSGLAVALPIADQVLNNPVAEPESKYAGEKKNPPERCFYYLSAPPSETSPDMSPSPPLYSP